MRIIRLTEIIHKEVTPELILGLGVLGWVFDCACAYFIVTGNTESVMMSGYTGVSLTAIFYFTYPFEKSRDDEPHSLEIEVRNPISDYLDE